MILTRLKACLRGRGAATAGELAAALGADVPMVEAALQYWRDRGDVLPLCTPSCAIGPRGCRGCPLAAGQPKPVAWSWREEAPATGKRLRA